MGSPRFAVPTLDALIEAADFQVGCVVSQPDRPKGRGRQLAATPVKQRALDSGLLVLEMTKKNYHEIVAQLTSLAPVFVVVAAFGLILRDDLLMLPASGCINLHPSLLPRYRGVSPVQSVLLSGDSQTGCTTMMMDAGVDTGDLLLARSIDIADDDNAGTLEAKLALLGAPLVIETLRGILAGTIQPKKQDEALATYTKKVRKEHGLIDWTQTDEAIRRRIQAMNPWPAAYTSYRGRRVIVLEARVCDGPRRAGRPGEVVSLDPLVVAAGRGAVELVAVKVEGKRAMPAGDFQRGYRLREADHLG